MRKIRTVLAAAVIASLCGCGIGGKPSSQPEETKAAETRETRAETVTETETQPAAETEPETEEQAETEPEPETAAESVTEDAFYIRELDEALMERIRGKSFKENCTTSPEELRYLHVLHKDLEGNVKEGEMICNVQIAEDVLEILRELYENSYPIEKIRLVDEYNAEDEASMADNNSSGFNFRFISYTTKVSKHGYGLAVDINPLYNPYTKMVKGERSVEPANGWPYLDRDKDFPYKITRDDLCCQLFLSHGFTWGGDWKNSKDYQHFEK
ncbi:MAG: M15 family metallopeptidase [Stomatobaculum sp.]|nr:M15 family metallopeptidase [Stomatobaculum sp.]